VVRRAGCLPLEPRYLQLARASLAAQLLLLPLPLLQLLLPQQVVVEHGGELELVVGLALVAQAKAAPTSGE
jgi:hypothetical protein